MNATEVAEADDMCDIFALHYTFKCALSQWQTQRLLLLVVFIFQARRHHSHVHFIIIFIQLSLSFSLFLHANIINHRRFDGCAGKTDSTSRSSEIVLQFVRLSSQHLDKNALFNLNITETASTPCLWLKTKPILNPIERLSYCTTNAIAT